MRPLVALSSVVLFLTCICAAQADIEAVGVYEFKVFTSSPKEYGWLGRGFQATVTTKLSNIPELKGRVVDVLGRSDDLSEQAFSFKGVTQTTREAGQMISASHIIGGELQIAEQFGVQVCARLRTVDQNTPLYGEDLSSQDVCGIFKLQGEIARKVAERLLIALNESLSGSLQRPETSSLTAYQYYLIAKDLPAEEFQAKITNYRLALEHDPHNEYALVNLAQTYYTFFREDPARMEEAKGLCVRAAKIDSAYADTYYLLGNVCNQQKAYREAADAYARYVALMGADNPFALVQYAKNKIEKLRKKIR